MAEEERPFVITVRHRWTLWILPVIAALYFLAVILLNVLSYHLKSVSLDMLVLIGVGLFALVILVELPFFMRRRSERAIAEAPRARSTPMRSMNGWDDELVTTSENQQGLQVVEYSAPAKSRNPNAVFTKTYVTVSTVHVVRVETLVADQADI